MAGNLVKWWKHKILGGYKQFSVQECTTDSEELMYHQVRASSSCSAPPDLLLVSDRENNIPLRSPVVNIIGATTNNLTTTTSTNNTAPATTTTSPSSANACLITATTTTSASNNNQKHNQKLHSHQHHHHVTTATTQQQLSLAYNGTKDIGNIGNVKNKSVIGSSNNSSSKYHQQQLSLQDCQQTTSAHEIEGQLENQTNNHSSTRHAQHHHTQQQQQHNHHHHQQQQQRPEEHIRLEEFTCDVSVEGGKSSQPLQFSFTFYDLDGHHGKITKDDIVGIVYTIYESIGKSVVVPHSGSKTINVRLTVSPEGKSKSNKTKKNVTSSALVLDAQQKSAPLANNAAAQAAARRLHRYRPRKLIKSDEEDDDSNSDKERDNTGLNHNSNNLSHVLAHSKSSSATKNPKLSKLKTEQQCCASTPNSSSLPVNNVDLPNSPLDTIYDNLKAANNTTATTPEACRECLAAVDESRNLALSPTVQYPAHKTSNTNEAYMKHVASTRIKMLRKSRKQKHQDCLETRQRSLSVGNETCWKNRHLQKQQNAQQQLLWQAEQQLNQSANVGAGSVIMDGVQLRNPLKNGALKSSTSAAQKRNSAECWKTALNRNDLISIIRESMEKNRLCFQLNGKPQANVSPIRHSQTPIQQQQPIPHHQQHLLLNQHNNSNSNKHSQHQTSITPTTSTQRQRSNTVSKIPTLIANHFSTHSAQHYHANNSSSSNSAQHHHHRSSSCANTINNNNNNQQHLQQHDLSLHDTPNITNSSNSNNVYHQHQHLQQPHIPIYHQQMAINPAIIAAHNNLLHSGSNSTSAAAAAAATSGGHHSKMNLCGYDSFLHATICGGGLSHSPPAHSNHTTSNAISPLTTAVNSSGHQQIATVQPIMSSQSHAAAKHQLSLAVTPSNQIKTSKILRSGSYAAQTQQQQQHHPNTTQNSPQYHGYQRLPSSSKHNLAALHLVSPSMEKPPLDQLDKWRRDQVKNYDQLLYAKLSEKLQQTQLVSSSSHTRESHQRRKHRILKQRRANNLIQEANNVPTLLANKLCVREDSDYATLIPIEGDAVECENLLGQSSEEENHSPADSSTPLTSEEKPREQPSNATGNNSRHVAEGTLVDLDDNEVQQELEDETDLQKLNQLPLNADSLLRVEENEVHDLHLDNGLDMEDDLADDLADVVEGIAETQSGRNSAASNEDADSLNDVGATLANTTNSGANTSTTSSSLIHRYVHEHIHHHYHHFEEKEE
ncbi:NKD inhibitor of WNT signaling pathway naked cuticle [Cochliomyia hominivorax]